MTIDGVPTGGGGRRSYYNINYCPRPGIITPRVMSAAQLNIIKILRADTFITGGTFLEFSYRRRRLIVFGVV